MTIIAINQAASALSAPLATTPLLSQQAFQIVQEVAGSSQKAYLDYVRVAVMQINGDPVGSAVQAATRDALNFLRPLKSAQIEQLAAREIAGLAKFAKTAEEIGDRIGNNPAAAMGVFQRVWGQLQRKVGAGDATAIMEWINDDIPIGPPTEKAIDLWFTGYQAVSGELLKNIPDHNRHLPAAVLSTWLEEAVEATGDPSVLTSNSYWSRVQVNLEAWFGKGVLDSSIYPILRTIAERHPEWV